MRFFEFNNPAPAAPAANPKDAPSSFVIDVPSGRSGTEVADVQKALMALGYDLPQHGVDGIRGPETSAAVSKFQTDNKLAVDGDPGPETVAKLNDILKATPNIATKLVKSTSAEVKAAPAGQDLSKLPPLSTDAATKGKVGEVLNLIARYESRGDYNIILGGKRAPLTTMSIAQVFELQRDMINKGYESSAVGRYQYIGTTLREMVKGLGLDVESTKFDEKTQDQIAIADLRRRCNLDGWLAGKVSNEDFLYKMSKVWASLPNPQTGGSFYAGVGSNKSGIKTDVALNTLQDINTASA